MKERAIGAEIEAGVAQSSVLRLEADVLKDVLKQEESTTHLEEPATRAEADAATAAQERDEAVQRLRVILAGFLVNAVRRAIGI